MKNQRKHDRISLKRKSPGVMKLILEDKVKDVLYIGDISPFGIMVQANYAVALETEVGLVHTVNNTNLEIAGTVKWFKILEETRNKNESRSRVVCELGISFSPHNLQENLDFFNSLASN